MGARLVFHSKKNTDWGCLRTGWWGQHLHLGDSDRKTEKITQWGVSSPSVIGTGIAQSVQPLVYRLDDQVSIPGRGRDFFLFATTSRPVLGPTQPTIQWVPGTLSPAVKWPGREADRSPPSSAEIVNAWRYSLHGVVSTAYVLMAWYLVKYRHNFTFYLMLLLLGWSNQRWWDG
jgi:hypothetical protein